MRRVTIKLSTIVPSGGGFEHYSAGEVHQVSDERAADLVKSGFAEYAAESLLNRARRRLVHILSQRSVHNG